MLVVLALTAAACGGDSRPGASPTTRPDAGAGAPSMAEALAPGTPAPRPLATKATLTMSRSLITGLAFSNVLLAQEMGEFAKENLEVRFVAENVVNSLLLVQQGQLEGSYLGFNAGVFNAMAAGADVRFVLPFGTAGPGDDSGLWARRAVLGADGRFDPCILGRGVRPNGTTVVSLGDPTGLGSPVTIALARFIESCPGQTLKGIKDRLSISTVVGANLLVALQQGAVDLALVLSPLTQTPGLADYAASVYPFSQQEPAADFAGWALGSVRQRQPPVADAFVRAVLRTVRTHLQGNYLANPEIVNALARILDIPADVVARSRPAVFRPDQRLRAGPGLAELQRYWADVGGLLSYEPPLEAWRVVDLGPVDRASRE